MNWSVAPALVVEPAFGVEVVEEFGVGFGAPEVHVGDFEVGPDCGGGWAGGLMVVSGIEEERRECGGMGWEGEVKRGEGTYNDRGYTSSRHYPRRNP